MDTIRRSSSVIWDVVDETMVLCETRFARFFHLNQTAALVWEACDESTLDGIARHVMAVYPNEDCQRLAADVHAFVHELHRAGLLEIESDPHDTCAAGEHTAR